MTFDEILKSAEAEGAVLYRPATEDDIQGEQKHMKSCGYPPIPQEYCEFLRKLNGFFWEIPGEVTILFFTVHQVAEDERNWRPQTVTAATGQLFRGADGDDLKGKKNYVSLASLIGDYGLCVYNTTNSRYEVLKDKSSEVTADFETFGELFIYIVSARLNKLNEYNINRIKSAKSKVEADGWVFFKYHGKAGYDALFKARPDGSELTCVMDAPRGFWSDLCNIKAKDGWIYFDVTESYSQHEDNPYVFEHYRDSVTYRVKPDGSGCEDVTRSSVHTGTSD